MHNDKQNSYLKNISLQYSSVQSDCVCVVCDLNKQSFKRYASNSLLNYVNENAQNEQALPLLLSPHVDVEVSVLAVIW